MKIVDAATAATLIEDGWTVSTGGFGSCGHPEEVTSALAERFLSEGQPRDLSLLFAAGQGDRADRGLNRIAYPGLISRVIGGFWGLVPALGKLARQDLIEAHNWPQGVISQLFRVIGSGQPGVITKVGLRTFVDPDISGGRLNDRTTASLVQKIDLAGERYLFYPRIPVDCAIIRGTTADQRGNITMENEVSFQDGLAQAQAAHNSGGIVIAQVAEVVPSSSLPPQHVKVPGILVDYVVVARPENHTQTYGETLNRSYTAAGVHEEAIALPPLLRRLIARRALEEIRHAEGAVVNLGIGIPAEIGAVAAANNINGFTLTVESGPIGGVPASGLSFGASTMPEAIIDQSAQFDFYDGGGIDTAFLGFAQVDREGNVNISRFGDKMPGVGGFVNISQSAKQVVFCGTFKADGLEVAVEDGRLVIVREGSSCKFVNAVSQISFSGGYANEQGRQVTYVTERAVFKLKHGVLHLVEVAPGIDLKRDIIGHMESCMVVDPDCREMDRSLFR